MMSSSHPCPYHLYYSSNFNTSFICADNLLQLYHEIAYGYNFVYKNNGIATAHLFDILVILCTLHGENPSEDVFSVVVLVEYASKNSIIESCPVLSACSFTVWRDQFDVSIFPTSTKKECVCVRTCGVH